MSWSELERFVDDVEADTALQRALTHCRSRKELILAARRLGYRITRIDLQRAWQEEQGICELISVFAKEWVIDLLMYPGARSMLRTEGL